MESLELQHAFVTLSAATSLVGIAAFVRHITRTVPFQRRIKYEYGIIALVGMWGFLLFTYWEAQSIRDANARTLMIFNAKNIALAAHDFHEVRNNLPGNLVDPLNVGALSWRVSICPYLEANALYQQFDLAKAWNDPRNFPLVEKMPVVYSSVLFQKAHGTTPWQGFVGPGTAFEGGNAKLNLRRDFPDGTSNTILIVEAQDQVPWSKPADIPFGPGIPLPALGQHYNSRGDWPFCCPVKRSPSIMVCMVDGTVRSFAVDISEATLRALIVRNDGVPAEFPD